MNIEAIFNALQSDEDNSGLGIFCSELEDQGYDVSINGIPVSSSGFFEGIHEDIEKITDPLVFSLSKEGKLIQKFLAEFVDFHEVIFRREEKISRSVPTFLENI